MKKIKLGSGFAIFIIFFGVAAFDAVQTHYWPRIAFWLIAGALFVVFDNLKKAH
ncbi:MAG: hypothetical protein ACHQF0_03070 [Chitinophagales bacterium]